METQKLLLISSCHYDTWCKKLAGPARVLGCVTALPMRSVLETKNAGLRGCSLSLGLPFLW